MLLKIKTLRAFPLRSGKKQGCLHSPVLFIIVVEVLASSIKKKKKEIKGLYIAKEEMKMLYFKIT